MSLITEQHHCCNCGKTTTWTKHASYDQCQGCRTRFPCEKCRHVDCMETRGEVATCAECKVIGDHLAGCAQKKVVDLVPEPATINPP